MESCTDLTNLDPPPVSIPLYTIVRAIEAQMWPASLLISYYGPDGQIQSIPDFLLDLGEQPYAYGIHIISSVLRIDVLRVWLLQEWVINKWCR